MVPDTELPGYRLGMTFLASSTAIERDKSKGREKIQEARGYMEDGYISYFLGKVPDRI